MVLDPIPQSLPVHFCGSRPQPPTSRSELMFKHIVCLMPSVGYTATHCATHRNTLQHTATHCNTLCNTPQHTATHCSTLSDAQSHTYVGTRRKRREMRGEIERLHSHQVSATHCNTVQHSATHRNTLQHTATHRNTLQHTATH